MNAVPDRPRVPEAETQEDAFRAAAIKRLKRKRDFKSHLFTYVVVNAALWTIWAVDGAIDEFGWPWPLVVTFFWGLFVLGDANKTFRTTPISEAEIAKEVERLRGSALDIETGDDRPC